MSKQKTFFTSRELPHIFAHQSAPTGRCPSAETFEGKIYFSYATAIAQLVEGKNREPGVIINSTSYSVTTSGHLSSVRGAVSHIEHQFYVDDIRQGAYQLPTGRELVEHYLKAFERIPEWYNPKTNQIEPYVSRYAHKQAEAFLHRVGFLEEAIKASKFFGLPHAKLEKKLAKLQPEIVKATEVIEAREAKKKAAQEKRYKAARNVHEQRARAWLASETTDETFRKIYELPEELKRAIDEKNLRVNADRIEQWKNGGQIHSLHGVGVFLRVIPPFSAALNSESIVETSLGARFPLSHAERAFKLVQRCRKNHAAYHRNGHTEHVGAYSIDEITPDGHVRAGCHLINWNEIEDFANRQGWLENSHTNIEPEGQNQPVTTGDADEGSQPAAS